MGTALDVASYTTEASLGAHPDSVPVTPHATDPLLPALADGTFKAFRAVRANTAGTVVARTAASGTTYRTMNFAAGETRFVLVTHIKDTSTATGIEVMP